MDMEQPKVKDLFWLEMYDISLISVIKKRKVPKCAMQGASFVGKFHMNRVGFGWTIGPLHSCFALALHVWWSIAFENESNNWTWTSSEFKREIGWWWCSPNRKKEICGHYISSSHIYISMWIIFFLFHIFWYPIMIRCLHILLMRVQEWMPIKLSKVCSENESCY